MRKARQTRAFSILVRTLTVRNELDGFPVVELDREPFGFTGLHDSNSSMNLPCGEQAAQAVAGRSTA